MFFSQITVTVDQLPDVLPPQSYECVFELNDVSVSNPAVKTGNNLECMTPQPDELPRIPDDTGEFDTDWLTRNDLHVYST